MDPDLGVMYAAARLRICGLVRDVEGDTPVPGTPEWTVHDVIGHLRGIVEDALGGNLEGAPSPPWTAAQVDRARDKSVRQLIDEWAEQAPMIEGFLSSPAGAEVSASVFDIHCHEADLRGALGLAPMLPYDYAAYMFSSMAGSLVSRVAAAGLPTLRICSTEGDTVGPDDATVRLDIGRHEFHRASFGRRSAEQIVACLSGCDDPAAYVGPIVVFGPRIAALVD